MLASAKAYFCTSKALVKQVNLPATTVEEQVENGNVFFVELYRESRGRVDDLVFGEKLRLRQILYESKKLGARKRPNLSIRQPPAVVGAHPATEE